MSKRLVGVVAAVASTAGFIAPSSADAVTRATGVGAYAKDPRGGWVKDCRAAPVGAYVVSVYRCYVEEIDGSARLCAQIRVQDLQDIIVGGAYIGPLMCSDPNAAGAGTAGALRFSA